MYANFQHISHNAYIKAFQFLFLDGENGIMQFSYCFSASYGKLFYIKLYTFTTSLTEEVQLLFFIICFYTIVFINIILNTNRNIRLRCLNLSQTRLETEYHSGN